MPLIIDAHEDLAHTSLTYGRDYLLSAHETRRREHNSVAEQQNGQTVLGWPDYQRGQVAVVFGTLFLAPEKYRIGDFGRFYFNSPEEASRLYHQQLDYYLQLFENHPDKFRQIKTLPQFNELLDVWTNHPAHYPEETNPVGLVLLMESAEGLANLDDLWNWWDAGLRIIGPVWAGSRFCGGSFENGTFTPEGYDLMRVMAQVGYALDITHMNEVSGMTALDSYEGAVIATHCNARARIKFGAARYPTDAHGERHLSDQAIRLLAARGGVMGLLPYNRFFITDWTPAMGRSAVTLEHMADHIDHVCQLTGSARHVGIGTDFDGGFGYPAVPEELDTIADLQKLAAVLDRRGYNRDEIESVFGGNWQRILGRILPPS
ncbi:MAG: membrane dipeptidase [Anaerolineaceae bacterium]|nr:membrane dipeptidase [Anaerolineaceae bacterium]